MRILLVRHGRPEFDDKIVVSGDGVSSSIEAYANATVAEASSLDPLRLVINDSLVLSSALPRALTSANLLGCSDTESSRLLNESELPYPDNLIVPLPWQVFVVLFRVAWFLGYSKNAAGKRADIARSKDAAHYIQSLVGFEKTVVVVGHGIMNRLIVRSLKKQGWSVDENSGSGYWSVISMSRAAA